MALAGVFTALPVMADPVSLSEAVRRALIISPDIESAEASMQNAGANLNQTRGERGINVGAQGQIGLSQTDFTTARVSQTPRQIALQAELPLYTSGRLSSAEKAARQGLRSAEHLSVEAEQSVALETVEAYTEVWLASQALEVAKDEVQTLRLRQEETQKQLEQGIITRTDTALAASRLASAEAREASRQADLAAANLRFERLTGLTDVHLIDPGTVRFTLPSSLEGAISTAIHSNAGLAAARAQLASEQAREAQARGAYGPQVSLRASASIGEDVYFFFEDQIADVGAFVTFEMPLFTNGVRPASISKAGASRRAAEAAWLKRQQALRENVGILWYRIIAQKQALTASMSAEDAAGLAVEGARREYSLGLRTLAELLDAENEYSAAAIAHRTAQADLLIVQARLLTLLSDLQAQLSDEL